MTRSFFVMLVIGVVIFVTAAIFYVFTAQSKLNDARDDVAVLRAKISTLEHNLNAKTLGPHSSGRSVQKLFSDVPTIKGQHEKIALAIHEQTGLYLEGYQVVELKKMSPAQRRSHGIVDLSEWRDTYIVCNSYTDEPQGRFTLGTYFARLCVIRRDAVLTGPKG